MITPGQEDNRLHMASLQQLSTNIFVPCSAGNVGFQRGKKCEEDDFKPQTLKKLHPRSAILKTDPPGPIDKKPPVSTLNSVSTQPKP